MKPLSKLAATAMLIVAMGAGPGIADPKHGPGKGSPRKEVHREYRADRDDRRDYRREHRPEVRYVANCPPGLAKKNPPCIPPGQLRKHDDYRGYRVGEIFRPGDYVLVRDLRRYDLQPHPGWNYYRDDNRIYRVDSGTKKVLAVLNLIDAFSN